MNERRPVLVFGELLWDLLPTGPVLGGAPANVAYRLTSLGVSVRLISRVGSDREGRDALEHLEAVNLDTRFVQTDPSLPTGFVSVQLSNAGEASYCIHTNVAYDGIELNPELLEAARGASAVCFGTLAQRSPVSRATLERILEEAAGSLKLLDINLRDDCYTIPIVERSLEHADVFKGNEGELSVLAEMFSLPSGLENGARRLLRMFDLDTVVVTRGALGVYALSASGAEEYVQAPPVDVVDTIGAGDAWTAGFCAATLDGASLREACIAGVRLGAAVAGVSGGTGAVRV